MMQPIPQHNAIDDMVVKMLGLGRYVYVYAGMLLIRVQ